MPRMRGAPRARLRATLLKSPIQATVRPVEARPTAWRMVSRSASDWHGWPVSDSRLTTGIDDAAGQLLEDAVVEHPGRRGRRGSRTGHGRCRPSARGSPPPISSLRKVTGWPAELDDRRSRTSGGCAATASRSTARPSARRAAAAGPGRRPGRAPRPSSAASGRRSRGRAGVIASASARRSTAWSISSSVMSSDGRQPQGGRA